MEFLVTLGVCLIAAAIGRIITRRSLSSWYNRIYKPAWTPPREVFGVVWTMLYLLMAVAAALVWRSAGEWTAPALQLFGLQLLLNVFWSALFFGFRSPVLALADIMLLWAAIAGTIALFLPISPLAAALMTPYLAWVSLAVPLNAKIWLMNRQRV